MKKISLLCCFVLLLCSACKQQQEGTIERVTAEEMKSLISLDDVQLVDVRTKEERLTQGYIANSQHIDYKSDTFDEDIKQLDKTMPVVLYCRTGNRSAKCAKKLKDAGFVKIYDLQGGISEWKHQGHEVVIE